jgi:mono/diheme cytochrome c family protein
MPAYGEALEEHEIADLVSYLKSIWLQRMAAH